MDYYISASNYIPSDYCFLYNTEDRSVRLVEQSSDILLDDTLTRYSKNISKLRMLGFSPLSSMMDLTKYICRYRVDGTYFALFICVNIQLKLCTAGVICNSVIDVRKNNYGVFQTNSFRAELYIPSEMFEYILDLGSRYDFDGIMNAFDGLFGVGLCKVIKGFSSTNIVLDGFYS